jgi:putative heme-binding domain-containing protein
MRLILALLLAAAGFGQQNPYATPADVSAGAKAFRSHCAECHGTKAEGGRGPALTTGVFFHGNTDAELFNNISGGIPGTAMPSLFFPPEGVWQIVAYVRTLGAAGAAERPSGDAARGATLFREKGCATCHLVRGEGGVQQGPDLTFIGSQRSVEHLRRAILDPNAEVSLQYRVARIALTNGTTYSGFLMNEDTYTVQVLDFSKGLKSLSKREVRALDIDKNSLMPSYKDKLSQSEMNDLLAYLWSLRRQPGRSE